MTAKKASRGKARLHPLVRLTPRYSGRNSHGFWRRVNSLKGKDWDAAYSMGVALQNHEHTVLQFINAKPNNTHHRQEQAAGSQYGGGAGSGTLKTNGEQE